MTQEYETKISTRHVTPSPRKHSSAQVKGHGYFSGLTLLDHSLYSLGFSSCDFGLFPKVKKSLKGRHFSRDDELLAAPDQECVDIPEET